MASATPGATGVDPFSAGGRGVRGPLLIVTLLTVSAVAYLMSRAGFFYRTRTHHRASRAILDQFFDATTPALTTIIPSYQEDARVIRNTVLSAALQEYPDKRVVLLIDDPFQPKTAKAAGQLAAARALPREIGSCWPGPRAGSPAGRRRDLPGEVVQHRG
jgi:cellulose synthase/poly-beta-1,6-N-acetylglucosamine synthase-like glycosyltransferase